MKRSTFNSHRLLEFLLQVEIVLQLQLQTLHTSELAETLNPCQNLADSKGPAMLLQQIKMHA